MNKLDEILNNDELITISLAMLCKMERYRIGSWEYIYYKHIYNKLVYGYNIFDNIKNDKKTM